MSTWRTKQVDYHRRCTLDLTNISTAGASEVRFKMRKRGSSSLVVDALGTIVSATRVSYQFTGTQLDEPGTYVLEVVLTYVDGTERVPTVGYLTVYIEPNLG